MLDLLTKHYVIVMQSSSKSAEMLIISVHENSISLIVHITHCALCSCDQTDQHRRLTNEAWEKGII